MVSNIKEDIPSGIGLVDTLPYLLWVFISADFARIVMLPLCVLTYASALRCCNKHAPSDKETSTFLYVPSTTTLSLVPNTSNFF